MNISINGHVSKKLITVKFNESVESALMIMKSNHFRHLPVVDHDDDIIGIVSDRDLYQGLNSSEVDVSQVMSKNLKKIDIKTDLKEIVKLMIDLKISAFLVTQYSKVIGIITTEDLMQLLLKLLNQGVVSPTLLEEFIDSFQEINQIIKNPNFI